MKEMIGLDFETYGSVDLRTHGLYTYTHDESFRPLIAALTTDDLEIVLDFTEDYEAMRYELVELLDNRTIVAHNAGFEQAVLDSMGIQLPASSFIDSAVLARIYGAGSSLEAAAPQILGVDKLEIGKNLIQLFSIPGKYQEMDPEFDPQIKYDHPFEWLEFQRYCLVDAKLSLAIAKWVLPMVQQKELEYAAVTLDMNQTGWNVDIEMVKEMHTRYLANMDEAIDKFREECDAADLNLSSPLQLTEWCKKRGVKATSFDEAHVESMLKAVQKKIAGQPSPTNKLHYIDVLQLLETKQMIGGSSLKKLNTILNTAGSDRRLHDQYLHVGAAATHRTTGRGVQMQNLKRLNGNGDDMLELYIQANHWDNDKLASNLRQVFTSTHPFGRLIVGDFASVESRGLAWQAGETWKLDAYFKGDDLYKVQAGLIFGVDPTLVTKEQRQIGKVGELACGYQAGAPAVREFAAKMGVVLSEGESTKLVKDWRSANTYTVDYWYDLDRAMRAALDRGTRQFSLTPHGYVEFIPEPAPLSLRKQVGDDDLLSLRLGFHISGNFKPLFSRVLHGAQEVGRNVQYWKPSERKNGNLWSDRYTDPKTKQTRMYTVYGGKLAGLMTQSLCREVFFESLLTISKGVKEHPNVLLVGQFHDEIVLDWAPHTSGPHLGEAMDGLRSAMTATSLPRFPLAAEIKADYRYTK